MAPVIKELNKYPNDFETIVVATAQHRQMLDQVLKLFEIIPNYDLDVMEENQILSRVVSNVSERFATIVTRVKPNWILVQGDTTTTFICALIAFFHKVKVGHIEAGLRTRDKFNPFPEEMSRRLVSTIVDLHFAPTEKAKQNLLSEGLPEEKIFVTGNTVIDALFINHKKLRKNKSRLQVLNSQFPFLNSDFKLILVTAHRRENFGKPLENICFALKEIVARNNNVEVVYPVHFNPNVQKTVNSILKGNKKMHLIDPLDYESFIWLMSKSYLILTDSGGIQEEAPSLGKPVLVLREVTERPEAVEAGAVKVIGIDKDKIVSSVQLLLDNTKEYKQMARVVNPYGDGKASKRIVEIVKSTKNKDKAPLQLFRS